MHLANSHVPMTVQEAEALPDQIKAMVKRTQDWHCVNARTLNDYDARKLKTSQEDGYSKIGPEYQNP